jgi:hypothetical protein
VRRPPHTESQDEAGAVAEVQVAVFVETVELPPA